MKIVEKVRKLCTPAYIYLVISFLVMFAMLIQNLMYGSKHKLCIGGYCIDVKDVSSANIEIMGAPAIIVFIVQAISILLWTCILNWICKVGYPNLSWFLVLLPYLSTALAFSLLLLNVGISR